MNPSLSEYNEDANGVFLFGINDSAKQMPMQ